MCSLTIYSLGAFLFCQAVMPMLLDSIDQLQYPPTLLVTGATAAIRGSPNFAQWATANFSKRALSQSLAREFGPKGIHVAHAIIDGVIDLEAYKKMVINDGKPDGKLSPEGVRSYLETSGRYLIPG
jgi:NAD(P)-dependent dehydrogenase (short-subunit alcohol dehydrogenase family)